MVKEKHRRWTALLAVFLCLVSVTGLILYRRPYHEAIPVRLTAGSCPMLEIEIQGKSYPIAVDLGSKLELSLDSTALEGLHKEKAGSVSSRDMYGNTYETPAYYVREIKMGDSIYRNVLVDAESKDFVTNTTFWIDPKQPNSSRAQVGAIGRGLLKKKNLLLDFKQNRIFFSNDVNCLYQAGYDLKKYLKIPFSMGRTGIVISICTDRGPTRFSLDTGSTLSLIRPDSMNFSGLHNIYGLEYGTSSSFVMADRNFGPIDLYFQAISPELTELDGILGMDFLKRQPLYIDYDHRLIYIQSE